MAIRGDKRNTYMNWCWVDRLDLEQTCITCCALYH